MSDLGFVEIFSETCLHIVYVLLLTCFFGETFEFLRVHAT